MDRRDQELLNRPIRRFQLAPRGDGVIVVGLVVAFLAGMTASTGGIEEFAQLPVA